MCRRFLKLPICQVISASTSTGNLTVSLITLTTPRMNSLQALPPEVWASICGELDERRHLVLLRRTSRHFRDQTQRILYYRVDLEKCSMRSVKSWCLAATRHSRLAERVQALALLLPGNLKPSDATKIERALTSCLNLKELKLSGEVYPNGRRVNSLNGWMINDCPFRLTKFSNSILERSLRSLPNLIAVGTPWQTASRAGRPLQRIEIGFQTDSSSLAQYSKTLTTLNMLRIWFERTSTIWGTLISIADLLPALVHLGIVEREKKFEMLLVSMTEMQLVRIYHMDAAADREALGLAIMEGCPTLRWTVLGAEVQLDEKLTCTQEIGRRQDPFRGWDGLQPRRALYVLES
ncbi:hypothetical protein FB451DRAFT_1369483 [Mycena latifolia]|nr:hypothetical protein FB451DRAFT_1369483 [Mycena latifolia]